ncbi:hypothetical protein [Mesorhizobium sp.]|uniref:hypothetical protein n=1 Tax=Mesorhizobium sp. TaxID=1871066 RepID=UPI0025BE3D36|nr:hypothetical protein [Mesorhizobium sp.]
MDHIIPESLLDDSGRLQYIFREYGLPIDFSINSYANWLPAYRHCNREKENSVFDPVAAILAPLNRARKKFAKCGSLERKCLNDKEVSKILNAVERALNLQATDLFVLSHLNNAAISGAQLDEISYQNENRTLSFSICQRNTVLSKTDFDKNGRYSVHTLQSTFGDVIATIDSDENVTFTFKPYAKAEFNFKIGFLSFGASVTFQPKKCPSICRRLPLMDLANLERRWQNQAGKFPQ